MSETYEPVMMLSGLFIQESSVGRWSVSRDELWESQDIDLSLFPRERSYLG